MKKSISIILLTVLVSFAFAQDKPAYKLFDKQGEEAKYTDMIDQLKNADLVFFGELHDNPISHWLQFEVTKSLYAVKNTNLILGAEMFEADNQLIMDEYLAGIHPTKKFEAEIRLWGNYKTDYKPLVEFAKENQLYFVASNIPRRYASLINKKGFEGLEELSAEAKSYIGPDLVKLYDPEVACYKNMMKMSMMPGMTNENFPKSQASKDATMAHFILKNWSEGKLLIHYQGAYHSDNFEGIVWWVKQLKSELNIMTISTVLQEDVVELNEENLNRADYIIAVPETMTRTNR